jgi:hypothetical protein
VSVAVVIEDDMKFGLITRRIVAAVVAISLSGCGSSGGNNASATPMTTPTATGSSPVITKQPASLSIEAGAAATLSVVAAGTNVTYQWYKAGTAITGATAATYIIPAARDSDAASYYVVVTNASGTVTSYTVTVSVSVAISGTKDGAIVDAANAFLATLSDTQLTAATSASSTTTVLFPYSLANAGTWTNLPGARHGLRLNSTTLTAAQLTAADALIRLAVSVTGKAMISEIRQADDVINAANANGSWGSTLYSLALIGTPSTSSTWMLQVTGHQLAYNITYNAAYASATPMFIGSEPPNWSTTGTGTYTVNVNAGSGGTQYAPLEAQRAAVYNLATALQTDTANAAAGKLIGTYNDVIMGVATSGDTHFGKLAYPTTERGVLYSSLNATEQAYVKTAIEAWVNTQSPEIAAKLLSVYEDSVALASTYVGYSPGTGGTADFGAYPNSTASPLASQHSYIRIDGPRVWIEFVVQQSVAYPNYVNYSSLWRDKVADYGGSFGTGSGR